MFGHEEWPIPVDRLPKKSSWWYGPSRFELKRREMSVIGFLFQPYIELNWLVKSTVRRTTYVPFNHSPKIHGDVCGTKTPLDIEKQQLHGSKFQKASKEKTWIDHHVHKVLPPLICGMEPLASKRGHQWLMQPLFCSSVNAARCVLRPKPLALDRIRK